MGQPVDVTADADAAVIGTVGRVFGFHSRQPQYGLPEKGGTLVSTPAARVPARPGCLQGDARSRGRDRMVRP
ncbi:hypothetical protein GCM10007964_29330 [Sphaerisporangium melleum]|uniref:Uncharacterized protein n=1 Tax=Sphaerisporangium melleum TaxID=321316 RepID=A0A917VJ00_9ACTN|nr:hypothetical protein GCM10007964_29330 [Sphaerisporangium melleum]